LSIFFQKRFIMGKIGYGYGSEWHLLRHLGYHRQYLSQNTLKVTGGDSIEWLDIGFSRENAPLHDDGEFSGLEFIRGEQVQEKWRSFWPQSGNAQNWDAIGRIHSEQRDEWLLVEAKGHTGEILSNCGAASPASRQKILAAFEKASRAFGNRTRPLENWLRRYYQYANRLAVLYFLMNECVPVVDARLLFIYFYGENREKAECPQSEQDWLPAIQAMDDWLGVDTNCELAKRVHHLFLPVNPLNDGTRPRARGG
jgi:hypothetical protein